MRNIRHIFLLAALIPCLANAQVAYYAAEAARYSENLYEGSARTIAMGNAFTALGGDLGAVSINPASTAVLRSSEFSISGNFGRSYGNASINGNSSINSSVFNFYVPNVGVSFNFNTGNYGGLLNYSIGFVGNRTNDFNSIIDCVNSKFSQSTWLGAASCYLNGISESEVKDMSYFTNGYGVPASSLLAWDTYLISKLEGPNNEYIGSTENIYDDLIFVGGDLDQEFYRKTRGGAYQWALNFSGNVNDCFFFGANLNLHTLDYAADEIYTETAKTDTFDDGFKEMRHNYYQRTTGTGVSGKFGLIYLIGGFRIGATITTPTLLNITESEEQYMRSAFTNGRSYESTTDVRRYQYRIVSPFRFSFGAAYTFGSVGLLSVDYERVNYGSTRLSERGGSNTSFRDENKEISSALGGSNIWRFGAEINLIPELAIRGGYNIFTHSGKNYIPYRSAFSVGLGYRISQRAHVDLAYNRTGRVTSEFSLYDDYASYKAPVAKANEDKGRFILTLGLRF